MIKLEAVDQKTAQLTQQGFDMSVLPTDPTYSKLLVTSIKPQFIEISEEVSAIVSMLSVENVFFTMTNLDSTNPHDKLKLKAIKKRRKFMS